jgi:preprotein translocase subunit SecE
VNRETKRLLQRQGQLGADGTPQARTRPAPQPKQREAERRGIGERTGDYFREVRNELVKVAWPPRTEVVNYGLVVLVTLVVIVLLIFALNWAFGHAVIWLYKTPVGTT